MSKTERIWNVIVKVWKDPVWSKVISAGIILLVATLWTKYSNYSAQEVYTFIVSCLKYELPVFVFLSIIGLFFLTKWLIRFFKRNKHPIWDEQVGNYKFGELYHILLNQNLPFGTNGMNWSGQEPPQEDLLNMFHVYSPFFNKGVTLNDELNDGGYLYGVLAPKLVGYGLLEKIETKNLQIDVMDIKYQTSEVGYKFYALLEKSIYLLSGKSR
ncbi:hypothetical protein [Fluviicola taffensis]|uniref:Uncharacterized protein n=1 Tax=Fluviicola taffensis (strain DSM 16823 / NCIMB 13979 / RW262) TaxID=755732 RepID=F2IBL6_FLUTR|nr:hypothetical protein [Fluviicola taffensis]AEA45342.1 hypothetical protein Fluta_3370 [Fluviicola taffensis DSM 16823]